MQQFYFKMLKMVCRIRNHFQTLSAVQNGNRFRNKININMCNTVNTTQQAKAITIKLEQVAI